jgi:hypothetical protein
MHIEAIGTTPGTLTGTPSPSRISIAGSPAARSTTRSIHSSIALQRDPPGDRAPTDSCECLEWIDVSIAHLLLTELLPH